MRDRDRLPGEPYDWMGVPIPLSELGRTAEMARAGEADGMGLDPRIDWFQQPFHSPPFRARVTGGGSQAIYSFIEVMLNDDRLAYADCANGGAATLLAREMNGDVNVPVNAVVMMWPAGGPGAINYDFDYQGGGGSAGGSITLGPGDTLTFGGPTWLINNDTTCTITAGKTLTFTGGTVKLGGGTTLRIDGPPVNVTDNTTVTVSSGKTLSIAGPGSISISNPAVSLTDNITATISSGKTLSLAGPGSFSISTPNVNVTDNVAFAITAGKTLTFGIRSVWNGNSIAAAYLPSLDGITKAAANVDLNSFSIVNLADPASAQDAVTLAYLQANYTSGSSSLKSLYSAVADSAAVTSSGADATFLTGTPTFSQAISAGTKFRVVISGVLSATTGSNNLTVKVKMGTTALITFTLSGITSVTALPWRCEADVVVRTTGSPGTAAAGGYAAWPTAATPAFSQIPTSATSSPTTAATPGMDITGVWNNAGNSATARVVSVDQIG